MTDRESPLQDREPEYVYAASREEAQRLLDELYLGKYRAVPVRNRWWKPLPNSAPKSMGFARYCWAMGLVGGWLLHWIVVAYA